MKKGIEEIKAAAERPASKGSSRNYFKWAAGEEKVIRFLTDGEDILLAEMHEFVPCADGSKRSFVCRKEFDADCPICEEVPDSRRRQIGFGIALWRETKREKGQVVTVDHLNDDGKAYVGIIQQSPRNFWSFFWAAYDRYGTITDRDYSVNRQGSGVDTTYTAFPDNKADIDTSEYSELMPDLEDYLQRMGSEEYYNRFYYGKVEDDDLASLKRANKEVASRI